MSFERTHLPSEYSAERLMQEFERLEQALNAFDILHLVTQYKEPDRPRDGMTVLADGTLWNPGSGQGVYSYYNGAWHKLG